MLFSMRPPESRPEWMRPDHRPPNVEYLTPEDVAAPSSRPVTTPAENQATPTTGTGITAEDRTHPITPVIDPDAPGSSTDFLDANESPLTVNREVPRGSDDSQDYPAVEIIEEITGQDLFTRVFVGPIPFSSPPITHDRENPGPAARVVHRSITLNEIDPHAVYSFDEGMALVRAANHRRLDGNHGTHPAPAGTVSLPPRPESVRPLLVRPAPPIFITRPMVSSNVFAPRTVPVISRRAPPSFPRPIIPDPPSISAKPRPPPMPTYLSPGVRCVNANRLTNRVLSGVDSRFHPTRLMAVDSITEEMRVAPLFCRTGVVHPPLPLLERPSVSSSSSSASYSPPSPLRTTPEGIRLEITPTAMVLRNRPEEEVPVVTDPPIAGEQPDPETNPEC